MLINPELEGDEKEFLIYKWNKLTIKEINKRIKELTFELKQLHKKQKKLEKRKGYYSCRIM